MTKLVLITGVSKGLGRSLAIEMAKKGHTVIGCARSESKLSAIRSDIEDPPKHLFLAADVSNAKGVQEFIKTAVETRGVPDIVINNAGIINKNARFWEIPAAEFDSVVDINLKGTANVMREILPHLIAEKGGIVVNVSSGWGRSVAAEVSAYCASKWAVEGLSRAAAREVPKGVAVVALNPGVVRTEMLDSCFGSSSALYQSPEFWAPKAVSVILGLTALDNGASLSI